MPGNTLSRDKYSVAGFSSFLRRLPAVRSWRGGQPSRPVTGDSCLETTVLPGGMMSSSCFIAVDLGGTQIRTARFSEMRELEERVAVETNAEEGLEAVFSRIVSSVRDVWPAPDQGEVAAVALGAPGPLNFRTGILRFAPNLPGWVNVPLRTMLQEALGVPAFVGNDADVAALAEHRFGAQLMVSVLRLLMWGTY